MPTCWRDQRWIELEAPAGTGGLRLGNEMLDGVQDELTRGAALVSRRFVEPAVNITREIDGSADKTCFHDTMFPS